MRLKLLAGVVVIMGTLLSACETMTSSNRVIVSSAEKWALLPITNLSKTPLAGDRASALVETHLRARGVTNLETYQPPKADSVMALIDNSGQMSQAKEWALQEGYRYGITGDVQEWSYKNGLDNEPSVSMTLKFVDLQSDQVMWVANASRTGWGYSNLAGTANKTIEELLTQVRFRSDLRGRPVMAAATPALEIDGAAPDKATAPLRPQIAK